MSGQTLVLDIYDRNGRKTYLHNSIVKLNISKDEYQKMLSKLVIKYKKYFGRKNKYNVVFKKWRPNSKIFEGNGISDKSSLEFIRFVMYMYVYQNYKEYIDTTRYKTGYIKSHVDVS